MSFNVDNLVINRAIRGTMFDKSSGDVIFSIDQIKDPSIECSGEQVYVTDAIGQKIATFDRTKEAKLTGSNALVHLGLAAAQLGSKKEIASAGSKLIVPVCDVLAAKSGKITLSQTPKTAITSIYSMTEDGSVDIQYKVSGSSATETAFTISAKEITLPTGAKDGDRFIVFYDTETATGISIVNSAQAFAKGGVFQLEVLFADVCDTNTEYHGFIIFNNAKMTNETTIDFNNEASHGFTIEAMQDYCSTDKELFKIVVAGQ